MIILYVFRSLANWGGIERILVEKMNYLVTMYGHEVYMLTSDQGNHPVPYQLEKDVHLEDLGIRFHQQYQYHGLKRLWIAWRLKHLFKHRLSNRLQTIKPDVIVCTTANYVDLDILVKLKGRTPLIVESHSIYRQTFGRKGLTNRYADFVYHKSLKRAHVIVALTEGDAADWRKHYPHVMVIPNMVHLNEGRCAVLDNKRVIWVGRLDYQKRPMEVIRIWKALYSQFPDWHLDIFGEGEQQQELKDMACSLNMNIQIHLPTDMIFEAYRESSVLVSTSLFEPFGLVIPEGMSCGLPVIAYNCPFGPEAIINDGENGFLVNNNDSQTFVDRLRLLMSDSELRHKMGKQAATSSQQYSPTLVMPMWINLFEDSSSKK